jgi:hypothetical protein
MNMNTPGRRSAIYVLLPVLIFCGGAALADDGVVERAVPSAQLSAMMTSLDRHLAQLEGDARATYAVLSQRGVTVQAILSARYFPLAALAQTIAKECRSAIDVARAEKQLHIQEKASRIARDSDAISRQLDEARAKAQQATQAASMQLMAGIINAAVAMKGAIAESGSTAAISSPAGIASAGAAAAGAARSGAPAGAAAGAVTGSAASGAAGAGAGSAPAAAGGAAGAAPGSAAGGAFAGPGAGAGAAGGAAAAGAGAFPGAAAGAGSAPGAGARAGVAPPTLDQKVAFLEQQVQTLMAQVAALQSVLKVTATGAVLQAPTLSLLSIEATTIRSSKGVAIDAGTSIDMRSSTSTSIRAASTTLIEGSASLDLKGAIIKHNGGGKPLATIGSQVQIPGQPIGQITTGSQTVLGN